MAEIHTSGPAALRRSPLAHLHQSLAAGSAAAPERFSVREIAFTTQIGVRATPGGAAHQAISEALDAGLPSGVGEVCGDPATTAALWLAPDEFLVVAETDRHDLLVALTDALGEHPGQVVDLSANRTILEISGDRARDVLEKGVPVDLHPRGLPPGSAVVTTLSLVPVLLWRTGTGSGTGTGTGTGNGHDEGPDSDTFRVMPRISFADHVARWLLDASREHRPASTPTDQPEEATCPATVG
ncbi:sarcosine oxidase subunit gamma [Nesterenkonia sp. K-15-9-6]|uniref:sarcosine oxidase subunit gamma n=1 Tax=Nesterenkonia sp. K-15-9-6 TaxID=3093918 RepID=UPI0040447428